MTFKSFNAALLLSLALSFNAYAKTALIFGGEGTENDDPTGTLYSAVRAAREAGFVTQIVTTRLRDEELNHASVWIQPGGPNFDQAEDMQRTGLFEQVKTFVASGGGYVGFCGGGFMAQSEGSLGLGLLPGNAMQQGEFTHKTGVIWNGIRRYIHFEHGPRFEPVQSVQVFATYESNGAAAGIRGNYGMGKVVLSGPHPEAQADWEPIGEPDGSHINLAVEMIQSAAR
jgi:glutamine amidotransferase-like uncharacterized protein